MLALRNARLFDGSKFLPELQQVTLDAGRITAVGKAQASAHASTSTPPPNQTIDLQGMTLMPGLITCHLHPDFYRFSLAQGQAGERPGKELPPGVMMAIGVRTCRVLLESGFTGYVGAACAHDIDASLKIAIAEGIMSGPRIRACSHHIGTTADLNDSTLWWKRYTNPGIDLFADGPDELRKVVREEIRRGAETIKLFASSGRGFNGRTVRNMTRAEIQTIVETAHDRGARVRAHVSDKTMILECIELGVDVIDHGDEIDQECIDAMVKTGTFWVPSLTYPRVLLEMGWGDPEGEMQRLYEHERAMLPIAQKAGVRILVGDDYSGVFRDILEDDPLDHQLGCYGREFDYYAGIKGLSAEEVLSWGTKNAGELLLDQAGEVGVIQEGALADLIVVDADPQTNLQALAHPEQHLKAVIRDGEFVLNRLTD